MSKVVKNWEFSPRHSRTTGYPWGKWIDIDQTTGHAPIFLVQRGESADFTCTVRAFTTQLTQQASKRKDVAVQYDAVRVVDGKHERLQASDPKATGVIFQFYNPKVYNPEEDE